MVARVTGRDRVQYITPLDCSQGKRGYPTKADAKRVAKRNRDALNVGHIYRHDCGYWHITSMTYGDFWKDKK